MPGKEIIIPLVSIIIVNWNGKHFLDSCLKSIMANTYYQNYEIIIVDNNSIDGSVQFIIENYPKIKIIQNSSNVGFGKANNIGVNQSKGEYIVFLNNDTQVMPNWLTPLVALVESNYHIAIVGSKIVYMDLKPQFLGDRVIPYKGIISRILTKIEIKRDRVKEVDFIHGSCFLIKRHIFKTVGFFDEKFFIYGEESDLCARVKGNRYQIFYNPDSLIKHFVSGTSRNSEISYYYQRKNAFRFALLNQSTLRLFLYPIFEIPIILDSIFMQRLSILIKAYLDNIVDKSEIREKRKQRRLYTFRLHSFFKLP